MPTMGAAAKQQQAARKRSLLEMDREPHSQGLLALQLSVSPNVGFSIERTATTDNAKIIARSSATEDGVLRMVVRTGASV